jgi:hydroxymethylbilane synthase
VTKLRIGSRGSALALWQANHVRELLRESCGTDAEIAVIKTSGDRLAQSPLAQAGGKGLFTREIEDALLEHRVDLAVHSLKDLPTELPAGLTLGATPKRGDVHDCLLSRDGSSLAKIRQGAKVGTGSLRRRAQLLNYRRDLELRDIRGNVDTRLRKLESGEFDGIVLARAGLERLGLVDKITEVIPMEVMLPAAGQGALGIECRAEDEAIQTLLVRLDDADTRGAITAERALLAQLEGGCQVPLGAWARVENGKLRLDAVVLSPDGAECVRRSISGVASDATRIGRALGEELLAAGADRLLRLAGRGLGQSFGA